jgi:DNA-binding MarR family transcriptional regulator
MSHPDLKQSDYAALAEFRHQIRRFLHFSEQAARRAGVEPQQHQLMLALRAAGGRNGSRIADLAERLQIQHHSAVELVSRLEEKSLIERNRGAEDRREVYVSLTPRGAQVLRDLTLHHREELRSAAPALIAALRRVNGRANHHSASRKSAARHASAEVKR